VPALYRILSPVRSPLKLRRSFSLNGIAVSSLLFILFIMMYRQLVYLAGYSALRKENMTVWDVEHYRDALLCGLKTLAALLLWTASRMQTNHSAYGGGRGWRGRATLFVFLCHT